MASKNRQAPDTLSILQEPVLAEETKRRLFKKVIKTEGCWLWQGATHEDGYGNMGLNGKTRGAHRIAYALLVGPIPAGLFVCHRCDNPPCVRPDHLFVATNKENGQDMGHKGRAPATVHPRKGEAHPRAILSDKQVLEIRKRAQSESQRNLAESFGICKRHINDIIAGRKWKHLNVRGL